MIPTSKKPEGKRKNANKNAKREKKTSSKPNVIATNEYMWKTITQVQSEWQTGAWPQPS